MLAEIHRRVSKASVIMMSVSWYAQFNTGKRGMRLWVYETCNQMLL